MIHKDRARLLKMGKRGKGPVVYWMSRDQRAEDNWALLFAQERALEQEVPLIVCFCLAGSFLGAPWRAYDFMLRGLRETSRTLNRAHIPFVLLTEEPHETLPPLLADLSASLLVMDFDPLRIKRIWQERVLERISIPSYEVDAHNVVPCWVTSPKREYAARTIRPKINGQLSRFLTPFPFLVTHPYRSDTPFPSVDWERVEEQLSADMSISPVKWLEPGPDAAHKVLTSFISGGLERYAEDRNDPTLEGLSNLSPYLHFGQLAPQRAALNIASCGKNADAVGTFLEELVIRRELADNFCYYTSDYDSVHCFPDWARKTLDEHRKDVRKHSYTLSELEEAQTHDDLWNAGQKEMVIRGKMHGWVRMYWAKKILEWSPSPEEALERAIYLNDRYELDGRDPNGYTGIAWSIGGVHDRAWPSHEIFGKVRYMNYRGASRKFSISGYVNRIENITE
jgi:deoxyribodipyrimidine photo-lyase